jgi:very-short-patch-repair endonuclease
MDWQERARQEYQQRIAEQERLKQLAAEQERMRLKKQFEEQQRHATRQAAERVQQAEERCLKELEQQTAAMQRIKEGLERANLEAQARLDEARAITQQLKMQATRVWISMDGKEFRSPLEMMFWNEWIKDSARQEEIPLIPQHPIGRYRVDFAHISSKIVIEIDGHTWHSKRNAINRDYERQHYIEDQGWRFIRFTGDQVFADPLDCVRYVYHRISRIKNKLAENT